jgi:hypothetical protein
VKLYEESHKLTYDVIFLYRPDVLLWKPIYISKYMDHIVNNRIVVNAHPGYGGDFHFLMNSTVANEFKDLFLSLQRGNHHRVHEWIKYFVINYMKRVLIMDDIQPGIHQEVLRKVYTFSYLKNTITDDILTSFGLSVPEIKRY